MSQSKVISFVSILCVLCVTVSNVQTAPANITDMTEALDKERAERLRLQNELDSLADKFTALESDLQMQKDAGWASSKSGVSFTAIRSSDVNIYPKQTLVFDQVLNNLGNVYNPTFGHFSVPVDGVYLISMSIAVQHAQLADVYLMNNTTEIYRILVGDANTNYYEVGSATLILHLDKGDVLYIQGRRSPDYIQGGKMSSFSGVLLHMQ